MEQFIFIILLLIIGAALRKTDAPENFPRSLNLFVIYVSLPATVLIQVPKIAFDLSAFAVVLVPWLLLPLSAALAIWLSKGYPPGVRAALLLVLPLGNTSFVGIPIIKTLLGEEAIGYVLMYDQFGTFLMLSLYGSVIIARYETGQIHKRLIVKRLVQFPPFFSLMVALAFGEMPQIMQSSLHLLSSTLVPVALISIGFSMKMGGEINFSLFSKALGVKLILMPLAALMILSILGVEPLALKTAVLESGMPSMVTAGALAMASGFAPALSSALVGYGLIVSLVTLPILAYCLERL